MTEEQQDGELVGDLRRALHHLYDPAELRKSPLYRAFGLDPQASPIALRRSLEDAIAALKPAPSVSPDSDSWRSYRVLQHRFIEQFSQMDVANNLGLSVRQLRRQELLALRTLADALADRYHLPPESTFSTAAVHEGAALNQERELQWVERSIPAEPVDLAEVIQSAVAIAAPLAASSGVQVALVLPDELPRVNVQIGATRQALLNLLTAAIGRAPGGSVRIGATVDAQRATVAIDDDWGNAKGTTTTDDSDGIALARRLIAPSGGLLEIELTSGATPFTARLSLPIAETRRVLVIDDNADALLLLQRFLHGSAYHFAGARDAAQALAAAEQQRPDAIVLDVMLPGIDGWELLGRLREHPHTRGVPVVVCTILPQEQLALALGAAAFLRKPVSRAALLQTLDQLWQTGATPTATESR